MQKGKNIKVFLSSTFKDMDAERDLIMNRVAPLLQERLSSESISVQFIDLRWGVNTQDTDENERENTVLRECIAEIRESRPFFIGLLGGRYGWIPSDDSWQVMLSEMTDEESCYIREEAKEQKSVTELEILFGALMDTDSLRRSLFCFRKDDVYEQMDEATRKKYCDQDSESERKLKVLKQKIQRSCEEANCSNNIYEYDSKWDGQSLKELDHLGDFLTYALYRQILLYEGSPEVQNPQNEYQILLDADAEKVSKEIATFKAESADLKEIEDQVYSILCPTIIHGVPGSGKTALLCELYSRVKEGIPLIHFCRQDENLADILKKWLADSRLSPYTLYGLEEQVSVEELAWQLLRAQENTDNLFYLFIDDMHLLKDAYKLINSPLITNGRIIMVATIDEPYLMLFEYWKHVDKATFLKMPSVVTEEVARSMIAHELKNVGKSLPTEVMDRIVNVRTSSFCSYKYPLWLKLVIRRLTTLSAEDFEKIRQRGNGDDAITQHLLEIVDDIAASSTVIEPMFASILFDGGKFLPFQFYWTMVRILAVSEFGLREEDFKQLFGNQWDQLSFTATKRWLGDLLYFDETTGTIDFAYPCYRRIIRHFCQDTDDGYPHIQEGMVDYFIKKYSDSPQDVNIVRELTALTVQLHDDKMIKAALSVPDSDLWSYMVGNTIRLLCYDYPAGTKLLSKALSVSENGASFVTDTAMSFYLHDNISMAIKLSEAVDADLMNEFYEENIAKYNRDGWEYQKMHQMLSQIHYAGFMFFTRCDDFMCDLLSNQSAVDMDLLNASESDNEDKAQVIKAVDMYLNLWSGGDDELEEIDTSDFSPEELIDYAESLLFVRFAPKHSGYILDEYESRKGDLQPADSLEIRANTLRCMLGLPDDVQTVMDYYELLQPHLKNLPDQAAIWAACKFLLLWNLVRKNYSNDTTSMSSRAKEAFSTFNSILKSYDADDYGSVLLLQLCFYNLCSTTEYCVQDMLYRGQHEQVEEAMKALRYAMDSMKQTHQNTPVTFIAYSLGYAVLSFFYEQHGDTFRAFYFTKQHEYAIYMVHQRFPEHFNELSRRYAVALSNTGWLLMTMYHQNEEAEKEFDKAMVIFKKIFKTAPSDLYADDLLKCAYRQMSILRQKGLQAESIDLGKESLKLVEEHPEVRPSLQATSNIHDELGDAYASLGQTEEAYEEMRHAGMGYKRLHDADPENENLMRDVIINGIRKAQLQLFNANQPAEALNVLDGIESLMNEALTQQPDSTKVRDLAMNYFVCLSQTYMALGDVKMASMLRDAVVKRLYGDLMDHPNQNDFHLLMDCLNRLRNMALRTNCTQLAEECDGYIQGIKQQLIEKRLIRYE